MFYRFALCDELGAKSQPSQPLLRRRGHPPPKSTVRDERKVTLDCVPRLGEILMTSETHLKTTYLFVNTILIDGPDSGHVRVEQLGQRDFLVAGSGADEPGLANGRIADDDAFHQFLIRQLVIHHCAGGL